MIARRAPIALLLAFVLAACGANARDTTIKDTFVLLNAARDGFESWNKSHEATIVANAASVPDGQAKLAAYRKKVQPILDGAEAAYDALKLAAAATDQVSLDNAVAAAANLVATITAIKKLVADVP